VTLPVTYTSDYVLSIDKVAHDRGIAGERHRRQSCEWKLQTHDRVQEVVHATHVIDLAVEGHEECRNDGDGSCNEDSHPATPLEVQETLKSKNLFFKQRSIWMINKLNREPISLISTDNQ